MQKNVKDELSALLQKHDKLKESQKVKEGMQQDARDKFLSDFKQVCETVIRPVMEEIGAQLKQHGHDFKIVIVEPTSEKGMPSKSACITMEIFHEGIPRHEYYQTPGPNIYFMVDDYKQLIVNGWSNIGPRSGGMGGPRGNYELKKIDATTVENIILEAIKTMF